MFFVCQRLAGKWELHIFACLCITFISQPDRLALATIFFVGVRRGGEERREKGRSPCGDFTVEGGGGGRVGEHVLLTRQTSSRRRVASRVKDLSLLPNSMDLSRDALLVALQEADREVRAQIALRLENESQLRTSLLEMRTAVKQGAQERARAQRLEGENAHLVNENAILIQRLGVLRKRNESLEKELSRYKGQAAYLEVVEGERGSMEHAQQRSGARLEALHARVQDLEAALLAAAEGLAAAKGHQARATAAAREDTLAASEVPSLREALARAREEARAAREEASVARREAGSLQPLAAAASRAEEHAAEASTLREQVALLSNALAAMRDERDAWEERVNEAEARGRRDASAEISSLRNALRDVDQSVNDLAKEQASVGSSVKALARERGNLDRMLGAMGGKR